MKTLTDGDYQVYMVKLPGDIHGACRLDADGFASIYINNDLSPKAQQAAFHHEMRHIIRDDHTNGNDIKDVEL